MCVCFFACSDAYMRSEIEISFELDSQEKVSIELSIIIRAIASNVSIGILKKIFNIALFASRPFDEKKLS